ncbi:hypothetical protein Glove_40g72 [Diversispora epigaea]|uniref:TLDc domain-containing protein n=1 Tax=Diversispora epigaea TaxID=1348612 RepID=A0A397JFL2_9GLOM|nr:hypothetical protein Glove_40g72 [Diversispora epigaea]
MTRTVDDRYDGVLTIGHTLTEQNDEIRYTDTFTFKNHMTIPKQSIWIRTKVIPSNDSKSTLHICLFESKHPNFIFGSEDFVSLPESALVSILKRDNLKKILDEQLWDDLIQYLLFPDRPIKIILTRSISISELPSRENKPFSTLINEEHALEVSISYKFQLILRGSRDGFAPKTFWDMCHGYANTIAIFKVEGTEILGGYNPLQWNKYYNLSLRHDKLMETNDNGLCFDDDLKMKSEVTFSRNYYCQCKIQSYEKPIRTTVEKNKNN